MTFGPGRDAEGARFAMVEHQLRRRGIEDARVLGAMARVPRELFVPPELQGFAHDDAALPIGFGQTISQPYIVALTCFLLELAQTDDVLEIGTGSGYAAAVLRELAASVVTVERIPELADRARRALANAGYDDVEVVVADGSLGVRPGSEYDAVAVAAAAPAPPPALLQQLSPGGRLVIPLGTRREQTLTAFVSDDRGFTEHRAVPCRFVPLIGAGGFAAAGQRSALG